MLTAFFSDVGHNERSTTRLCYVRLFTLVYKWYWCHFPDIFACMRLFADDVKLYCCFSSSLDDLKIVCDELKKWADKLQMRIVQYQCI